MQQLDYRSMESMKNVCRLDALAGDPRSCPRGACPFWEPGGAVLPGRCAFELLDLEARPAVADELRRLRSELERAEAEEEARAAWHDYHRLLNRSGAE
jgi:hypothetical protein